MAVYFVTGKLGSGKTLCCVGKIRDYLRQGWRVATNLDINVQAMTSYDSKVTVTRVPDKPTRWDLDALGQGCDESDESKYGLLVLDELGTWFNCRNWNDKTRSLVIDWFLHARKKHWDIFLIVQSIDVLDSQLVNSLCEHLVVCKRTDRLNIPFVSKALKFMEFSGKLPKFHIAKVYYGQDESRLEVDRWYYRATDLYACYNTDQIFSEDSDGLSTVLPAYYQNSIGLIDYYKKRIVELTTKGRIVKTDKYNYVTVCLVVLLIFSLLAKYTYGRWQDYHPRFFGLAHASSSPLSSSSPAPVIVPPSPRRLSSDGLSAKWRIASVVRNHKTKEYLVTVADPRGHIRMLPKGDCVFDVRNQPTCIVDNETVNLFSGSYSEDNKEDKSSIFLSGK
jgi:hypothetical protein